MLLHLTFLKNIKLKSKQKCAVKHQPSLRYQLPPELGLPHDTTSSWRRGQPVHLGSSTKLCTRLGINPEFNPRSVHEARQRHSEGMLFIQRYFLKIRSSEPLKIFSQIQVPHSVWLENWMFFFCSFALENKKKFLLKDRSQ